MCRLEGVEDSRAKQLRLIESVKQWKSEVGDCDWICRYYDDILGRLEAGKSVTEADEDMRLVYQFYNKNKGACVGACF